MKKVVLVTLILLFLVLNGIALAADVTNAEYLGTIRVTNNGTATENVSTPLLINTQAMLDGGYMASTYNNTAIQTQGGTDVAYMPLGGASSNWSLFVPAIDSDVNINYYLYTGGSVNMNGKVRYFPDLNGMLTVDSASMEPGDNFTSEQSGFVTTTFSDNYTNRSIVSKPDAFSVNVTAPGIITATIYGWLSPSSFIDADAAWSNEALIYDNDTGTRGHDASVPTESWSSFIEVLPFVPVGDCSSIRYYAGGETADITQIDVDSFYSGAWHDLYEGAFTQDTWEIKALGAPQDVTNARVRLYNADAVSTRNVYLFEFELYADDAVTVTASGIASGEHLVKVDKHYALYLDGTGDYVNCGNAASLPIATDSFSVEVSMAANTTARGGLATRFTAVPALYSWFVEIEADGTVRGAVFNNAGGIYANADATTALDDGEPHHVVLVWEVDVKLELFVDKVSVANDTTWSGVKSASSPDLEFGRSEGGEYTGWIEKVRVYKGRVLTLPEIVQHYNDIFADETGLAGRWDLNEGSGASALDQSGNGNTGTITNATWHSGPLRIFVDNALEDIQIGVTVPDTSDNWTHLQQDAMPYMSHSATWVDGVLQQLIVWEPSSTFTDQSGQGHDATPTFRNASSNPYVSAELISFEPITEATLSTWSVEETTTAIDVPPAPPDMYNELSPTSMPGFGFINTLLDDMEIPRSLFWFPALFGFSAVAGLLVYWPTKSLLTQAIVSGFLLAVFWLMGLTPGWALIPFAIEALALLLAKKHISW